MGHFKIENQIAQQVNYDDIAKAHGWTGRKRILDANGRPEIDAQGQMVIVSQTAQEFICDLLTDYVNSLIKKACKEQELLQGRLNYNASDMIALFKKTTSITWQE